MTTAPLSNLTATWNSAGTTFTAVKMNVTDTASAAASLLLDLQVGGTSQFSVSKGGRVTAQTLTIGLGGQTAVADNTAVGFQALNSASLTGTGNVGIGYRAALSITTGTNNTAVGYDTLLFSTATANTAIGAAALRSNTTGDSNTSVGASAIQLTTTGSSNSGFGQNALLYNVTGSNSTAVGFEALARFVSAGNQTAIGYRALYGGDATPANNTGKHNIGVGYQAGDAITTGDANIAIGYDVDVDSATGNNQINIGNRFFHNRLLLVETTDPAAPAANNAIIFCRDNGSGKTQICVLFPTGAVQVVATEP